MAKRRRAVAVLALTAAAGAGVAAGVFLTRGMPSEADASSVPTATSSAAPLGEETGLDEVSPTATASIGPDPDAGQTIATDEPAVVTDEEVQVTVTFAGWNASRGEVQVDGFVTGVVEDDGTCTLSLTKDGRTVTGSGSAVPNASMTACGGLAVPGDQVSAGTWQAVLSYRSNGHSGTSDSWDVEVPQ
jgi:hypothetical protein